MTKYIQLKGTTDGFQLHIHSDRIKKDLWEDLAQSLEGLGSPEDETLKLNIYTQDVYLSKNEKDELISFIEENSAFSVDQLHTDLLSENESLDVYKEYALTIETGLLRSGELIRAPQDLLFIGSVPQGAELQAGGSIYIIGDFNGTAYAGRREDEKAVIIGQFGRFSQLRIDTSVYTFRNEEPPTVTDHQVAVNNDAGHIEFQPITALKELRPHLNQVFSGKRPFEK